MLVLMVVVVVVVMIHDFHAEAPYSHICWQAAL
jgi:hypothetical protein